VRHCQFTHEKRIITGSLPEFIFSVDPIDTLKQMFRYPEPRISFWKYPFRNGQGPSIKLVKVGDRDSYMSEWRDNVKKVK